MRLNRETGLYVTTCFYCPAQVSILPASVTRRGYLPPRYVEADDPMRLHVCEPMPIKVPNERDFCACCGGLTWGEPCQDCARRAVEKPEERRWER